MMQHQRRTSISLSLPFAPNVSVIMWIHLWILFEVDFLTAFLRLYILTSNKIDLARSLLEDSKQFCHFQLQAIFKHFFNHLVHYFFLVYNANFNSKSSKWNYLYHSINQGIDIGQVEGAFVQGMGYFLSEKVSYDSETGVQLTTNTWVGTRSLWSDRFWFIFSFQYCSIFASLLFSALEIAFLCMKLLKNVFIGI